MTTVGLTGTSAHQHEKRQSWVLWVSLSLWRPLFQPLFDVCTCQHCFGAKRLNSWAVTLPEMRWECSVLPTHTQTLVLLLRTTLWSGHTSKLGMVYQKEVPAVWPGYNMSYHARLASFPVYFRAKTKLNNMMQFLVIQCLYHVSIMCDYLSGIRNSSSYRQLW